MFINQATEAGAVILKLLDIEELKGSLPRVVGLQLELLLKVLAKLIFFISLI